MATDLVLLLWTAGIIGFTHTLLGPDHYVPFVAMSRALGWSRARTLGLTALCGVGHVFGSVLLGGVGIAMGLAVTKLESWESSRGDFAAWFLIAFGLLYAVWGLRHAVRRRRHSHIHSHPDGVVHSHLHNHALDHLHVHADEGAGKAPGLKRATPWILFAIFVFGPCEPLIPLLMYPAAQNSAGGVLLVTLVFGLTTVATMTLVVLALSLGLARASIGALERYTQALAGVALLLCGLAMKAGL